MKINQLDIAGALASLDSSSQGLAALTAQRRLSEYGPNRLDKSESAALWRRLVRQFTGFLALILWLAAALAAFVHWQDPQGGMLPLAVAIVGVILINGAFSFWQEHRAERAITALSRLLPLRAMVLRDGRAVELDAQALVPGDIVLLQAGDQIPADCRVIETRELRVNEATVTGESAAVEKNSVASASDDLLCSPNVLLAGTSVEAGSGRALVYATGMRTEFGRIADFAQQSRAPMSPLQQEIVRLSRLIAVIATTLGAVFFAIGWMLGFSLWENCIFAIGIIVANVPEGLLPTVTLALAMGTQRMAKRQALIRHLPAVETLGSTTVICTDKTGTLTENRMQVRKLCFADAQFEPGGSEDDCVGHRRLIEVARNCHALREVTTADGVRWRGDPMEIELVALARRWPGPDVARIDEIPFDTDRKRFSTLNETPAGRFVYCKGALEAILPLCTHVELAAGNVELSASESERLRQLENKLAGEGMRVLAFAFRSVSQDTPRAEFESGMTFAGLVGFFDPVRPQVPSAIAACRNAGIQVVMVTGDHPQTALAVGRETGLVTTENARVITGAELARLTPAQLQVALDDRELLFARVGATQKMVIVEALQRKGHVVAATGDGVNDAPALKRADIGIAMAIAGTDVAKEAADMVLLDDNFASIVAAIEEGRAVYSNIRKFLTYILSSNVPELIPYLACALTRIPLPLTIMQILAVDLGTDMLPALALGAEPPHSGVMMAPPRSRREPLLTGRLLARAYLFLGALEALAGMAAFLFILQRGGWRYGDSLASSAPLYLSATTACFAAIVATQIVNVLVCRDERRSLVTTGVRGNPLLLWALGFEAGLAAVIIYSSGGQAFFGTAALDGGVWLFIVPFMFLLLCAEEIRKACMRVRESARRPSIIARPSTSP